MRRKDGRKKDGRKNVNTSHGIQIYVGKFHISPISH